MKRTIVVSLLVCVLVAAAGCLDNGGDTEATTMSMQEFSADYNQAQDQANGTMTFWLESVDEGDTVIIKDTIASITYDEQNQTSMVMFTSTSQSQGQTPLRFKGDITDEFSSGDTVAVTLHIVNVTMEQSNPQTGQTITYHYETFEEGWDAANETSVPLPQSTIEQAEDTGETGGDDGGDDTSNISGMTFSEFWDDYSQSVDNQTMTAITYLESFDEGDTVTITDQLQNLSYNATNDYTIVQFASLQQRALTIEGDITDEYQAGDIVILTSDIINATFNYQMQDKNWTIHYETFEDGWDTENNRQTTFPQEALQHAEG
ncbi:MAG: hypothetical protein R6U10_02895 [Thermoplasmatota archaeon]